MDSLGFLDRRGKVMRRRVLRDRTAVYHVMSRTVRGSFWLEDEEKEMLCAMVFRQAAFSGVEVLTYCMMGNHFHLLLRVSEKPLREQGEHGLTDEEILGRYREYYGAAVPRSTFSVAELEAALSEGGAVAEYARRRVLARMGDLSVFMKELKQRFGIWLNGREAGRKGTIWQDRFKSVLVENRGEVLKRVASYIDLNPVRAGLVKEAGAYRWSGYSRAVRGCVESRAGLCGLYHRERSAYGEVSGYYRQILSRREAEGRVVEVECGRYHGGKRGAGESAGCRRGEAEWSESIALGGRDFVAECQRILNGGKPVKAACWQGWQRLTGGG